MYPIKQVLSAYFETRKFWRLDRIPSVYNDNNKGLSTDPCGVPVLVMIMSESLLLDIVCCLRLPRKLIIYCVIFESRFCSNGIKYSTLIVLNAEEKSRKRQRA